MFRVISPVSEQRAHERGALFDRGILQKGIELFRRWEQSEQIEIRAARERAIIDDAREPKPMLREISAHKMIERMHIRAGWKRDDVWMEILRWGFCESDTGGPRRALVDPGAQQSHLFRCPLSTLLGH